MRLQHIRRWPPAWEAFLSACCCKNETKIGSLAMTSSWGYQHGFSAEISQFLSDQLLYNFVVNNLRDNEITFHLFWASSLSFWHGE